MNTHAKRSSPPEPLGRWPKGKARGQRQSREKREKPGPMDISHTDLTNLTKHASFYSRVPSGAQTLGEADKRGRSDAPSVRFVRSV